MTFTVTIRDNAMVEVGTLSDYAALDLKLNHMGAGTGDVGLCEVTVPTSHRDLDLALEPMLAGEPVGIVVRRSGSTDVVASGDVERATVDDAPGGRTVLTFVPDDSILQDEIPYPSPGTEVPLVSTGLWPNAYDTRVGVAETVLLAYVAANIGPAAGLNRRRYAWLTIPSSAGRGPSATWQARPPETLFDVCRRIAVPSGLAFRLAQSPTAHTVAVEVWAPAAEADVRLSPEAGTVVGLETQLSPRTVDEVVVMAGGEMELRTITRRTSSGYAPGSRRRVRVVDQRQTSDLVTMQQAADETMLDGSATAAATFDLVERAGTPRYGVDWRLGDVVTAATWRRASITAAVMSVHIQHAAGGLPVVTPSIGSPETTPEAQLATVRRTLIPLLRS